MTFWCFREEYAENIWLLRRTKRRFADVPDFPTGMDYMKSLGITHVHLLPVFDFATVDETSKDLSLFNWGYDPENYNVPEGSYATKVDDGAVRIREFKQMVQAFHEAGNWCDYGCCL